MDAFPSCSSPKSLQYIVHTKVLEINMCLSDYMDDSPIHVTWPIELRMYTQKTLVVISFLELTINCL